MKKKRASKARQTKKKTVGLPSRRTLLLALLLAASYAAHPAAGLIQW